MQNVADDDVPEQSGQGLWEDVDRDDDGRPRPQLLHEEGEVEGRGLESHEAQDSDGHDLRKISREMASAGCVGMHLEEKREDGALG